ncbi:MAG: hypothetical protein QNJ54_34315 [Prochloraceae cyanobacterium]|nr:hypothetical protein [Prochloraceae cyanobacterium]
MPRNCKSGNFNSSWQIAETYIEKSFEELSRNNHLDHLNHLLLQNFPDGPS